MKWMFFVVVLALLVKVLESILKKGRGGYYLKPLMSSAELEFWKIIKDAEPGKEIFAKVRLADFVQHRKFSDFNKICAKHTDFLICDSSMKPLLAIELDDSSHRRAKAQKSDDFKNRLYSQIGLSVLRVKVQKNYDRMKIITEIQRKITDQQLRQRETKQIG